MLLQFWTNQKRRQHVEEQWRCAACVAAFLQFITRALFRKIEWESFSMNRSQRLVLSLVCALALVLIPMSYLRAQSTVPQQDQTDQNSINQQNQPDVNQNQEPNLNQEKSTTPSNQDQTTREKPSSTEQDQNQYQQNQDQQNQPDTTRGSQ